MENKKEYEKGSLGWLLEQAKKDGFDDLSKWNEWKKEILAHRKELEIKRQYTNIKELEIKRQYANIKECEKDFVEWIKPYCRWGDKRNIRDWENGKRLPTSLNSRFVRQSYNVIVKRYGKDFADSWLKSIKKKIEENKENKEIDWIKDLEEKYGKEFVDYARENKDKLQKCVLDARCKTGIEYSNLCAQKRGFKNDSERSKIQGWNRGIHRPMSENKSCSSNFGIELGEKIIGRYALPILFGGIKEEMPHNNPGFEFIVTGDLKVNIKCRCLQCKGERTPWWNYSIRYNNDADHFLLIGFDTRNWLEPMYAWLIHKDEKIKKGKENDNIYPLWYRESFTITNDPDYLAHFKKYDVTEKLEKLKDICKDFKETIDEPCNNSNYDA